MFSFGYIPDLPDLRDYTLSNPEIKPLVKLKESVPASTDLREFCSPICDQGELGSCTAQAAAGIVEYFQKKAFSEYNPVSRMFIYKATRNLMKVTGDSGAYIRTTMGSLALFGVPPEKYWGYSKDLLDSEPPSFCWSFGQNYQALKYFRLDTYKQSSDSTLLSVKKTLCSGIPCMFGFTVYSSIRDCTDGKITFPSASESVLGGHAVCAVGYDDSLKIGKEKGALLIRNSWGTGWGEKGYGWLPYRFVIEGLAQDFWSLVSAEWVSTREFGV